MACPVHCNYEVERASSAGGSPVPQSARPALDFFYSQNYTLFRPIGLKN